MTISQQINKSYMGIAERKEREKVERKQAIIDAAESVFFSKGFTNTSMDDIAEVAELSKGTIYLYFHNKDDLYAAIVARGAKILNDMFSEVIKNEPNGMSKVEAIGFAFFKFYNNHTNYHDAIMFDQSKLAGLGCECENDAKALELKRSANRILIDAIREGIKDGSIRNDIDPVATAMVLWGSAMGVMQLAKNKGIILNEFYGLEPEVMLNTFMDNAFVALKP